MSPSPHDRSSTTHFFDSTEENFTTSLMGIDVTGSQAEERTALLDSNSRVHYSGTTTPTRMCFSSCLGDFSALPFLMSLHSFAPFLSVLNEGYSPMPSQDRIPEQIYQCLQNVPDTTYLHLHGYQTIPSPCQFSFDSIPLIHSYVDPSTPGLAATSLLASP